MQLVDVELEKHMESRTSTNSPKFLSHSIEEILKKPSSLTVQPDRTDKKLKTSGCTQTKTKTKTDAPKISQCTGVFSVLFWSFIVNWYFCIGFIACIKEKHIISYLFNLLRGFLAILLNTFLMVQLVGPVTDGYGPRSQWASWRSWKEFFRKHTILMFTPETGSPAERSSLRGEYRYDTLSQLTRWKHTHSNMDWHLIILF